MIPLQVPSSGPWYEGHFPGRPIFPGIGLLDLALRALPAAANAELRGIDLLRFRSLVVPGERLELHAQPGPDGEARLDIRRGADRVAGGAVKFREPAGRQATVSASAPPAPASGAPAAALPGGAWSSPAPRGRDAAGVPPLDRLLPHRAPMRFVTGIEAEADDGIVCLARLPEASPIAVEGRAPAFVAIEMAAQAAAVFEALRRDRASSPPSMPGPESIAREGDPRAGAGAEPGPRIGYLVGARGVRLSARFVPAGADCRVAIRLEGVAGALSSYRFEVARAGDPAAEGVVSTWITATAA